MENKDKLVGRIYPAIQSCVQNRYFIIIGIFAFYSFILTTGLKSLEGRLRLIQLYGSIAFSVIIIFNSINYCINSADQYECENEHFKDSICSSLKRNIMEEIFFIISNTIIWLSYLCIIIE